MAGSEKRNNRRNVPDGREEYEDSSLVDVFPEEEEHEQYEEPSGKRKRRRADDALEERDFRPVRMRRDGRLGLLGGVMYAVFIIAVSVIGACVAWMAASDVLALNKTEIEAEVYLPRDIFTEEERETTDDDGNVTGTETVTVADIDYVASQLKGAGLIEYKNLFKLYAKFSHADRKIAPGTYELSTRLDYHALVSNMRVGPSMVETTLTFPEGYTMAQIFESLEENDVCSTEDLYEAAANYNYSFGFLEDVQTGEARRLEGYIFPNTYDFYEGEQASSVINKFLEALHYRITAEMIQRYQERGQTFREIVTIASMIEKEAANDDERKLIASVIYNRLKAEMTLGIDATILYEFPDYNGGVNLPENIRTHDSPYNTNLYTGLPPTPICNPGISSINAALWPDDTGYYYYALDTTTGTHQFFTNSHEFEAFVATQHYD